MFPEPFSEPPDALSESVLRRLLFSSLLVPSRPASKGLHALLHRRCVRHQPGEAAAFEDTDLSIVISISISISISTSAWFSQPTARSGARTGKTGKTMGWRCATSAAASTRMGGWGGTLLGAQ